MNSWIFGRRQVLGAALALATPIYMVALGSLVTPAQAAASGTKTNSTLLSEVSNGKSIKIGRGSNLTITLKSTYWTFNPLANGKVLKEIAAPTAFGYPPGSASAPAGCRIPGSGCGTVTWRLRAVAVGSVTLTANRTSCGEAMRCTPAQSSFQVKIKVS